MKRSTLLGRPHHVQFVASACPCPCRHIWALYITCKPPAVCSSSLQSSLSPILASLGLAGHLTFSRPVGPHHCNSQELCRHSIARRFMIMGCQ